MAILVTGGAGFIGSHLCERLLEEHKEIVLVDNLNDYYDPTLKEKNLDILKEKGKYAFYKVDITDYAALSAVFQKHTITAVIHLAARAGVRASLEEPVLYSQVNVLGTMNLLECARQAKVKTFIFGSSSSVYGTNKKTPFSEDDALENIISPYAMTKRIGELLCKEYHDIYGLNVTCLRFFTVYGPRGRPDMAPRKFTEAVLAGRPIDVYGDGTMKRDYTYVSDIVAGIITALQRSYPFAIINLGDNTPRTILELITAIENATGKKATVNHLPIPTGDVPVTYADITKAAQLLNYKPKIKIEEGIKKLVASP
ncbi:MAG: SDR family NAD(P)-dependent oxidoreductase [Nanoarchaeota archaeon]